MLWAGLFGVGHTRSFTPEVFYTKAAIRVIIMRYVSTEMRKNEI
jgi:hypothetical protein